MATTTAGAYAANRNNGVSSPISSPYRPTFGYRLIDTGRNRSVPRVASDHSQDIYNACQRQWRHQQENQSPQQRSEDRSSRARREFFECNQQRLNGATTGQEVGPDGAKSISPIDQVPANRRRNSASENSSAYGSGDSDVAEEKPGSELLWTNSTKSLNSNNSLLNSPVNTGSGNNDVSRTPSTPSTDSSGCSPMLTGLRSTFTEEILRVLEQDGLILQASLLDEGASKDERRPSFDCNVIELSKKYRKQELSQLRAMDKVQQIDNIDQLQRMLDSTTDDDQRRAIRHRLIELKKKQREQTSKALQDLEARREKRINDKKAEADKDKESKVEFYDDWGKTGNMNMGKYKGTDKK